MRIFIDARLYGPAHTGIGRYTENVLKYLPRHLQGQALKGVILVHPKDKDLDFGSNWRVITTTIRPYSFFEQITIPHLVRIHKCNLYLGFHFNVPVFLTVPFVTVIHDLIKSYFTGRDTTTHNKWLYRLKRVGYEWSMGNAVNKSLAIIVPSNTVKNQILARYNQEPSKIHVIPEAPDDIFRKLQSMTMHDHHMTLPNNYLLYVGNAYPHKNLSTLLKAFSLIKDKGFKLVIVAKHNAYLAKLLQELSRSRSGIIVLSGLTDQELVQVYRNARALVTPSLMEGYGLPGLEALMVGTPVIASNIPVYREVYGDKVTYFNPQSPDDLASVINAVVAIPRGRPIKYDRTWIDVSKNIAEVIVESSSRLRSS